MRKRFVVRGTVQGVNFRATAAEQGRRLGLTGRIWNRHDGAVECIAEGEPAAVRRFGEWLGRGPRMADVEQIDEAELEGAPRYREFAIARETA